MFLVCACLLIRHFYPINNQKCFSIKKHPCPFRMACRFRICLLSSSCRQFSNFIWAWVPVSPLFAALESLLSVYDQRPVQYIDMPSSQKPTAKLIIFWFLNRMNIDHVTSLGWPFKISNMRTIIMRYHLSIYANYWWFKKHLLFLHHKTRSMT